MIKFEEQEVIGFEHAIRGMRNPMNSWDKSDSGSCGDFNCDDCVGYIDGISLCECNGAMGYYAVGKSDYQLMQKLAKNGPVHAKYRRMITVYVDITAPLYWWKEFDTYKVGTVANSCSTMHKIHEKELTLEDFSYEHLHIISLDTLRELIKQLNAHRKMYIDNSDMVESDRKIFWWQIIQLLPSSYNQKRTIMMNYEVLSNIYQHRRNHKLDEWRDFCKWIEKLPYSEIICGDKKE